MNKITLSPLGKTWILDLDGTIVKHNGYKIDGHDTFLKGAAEFLKNIPETDMVIFLTSRTEKEQELTVKFLNDNRVRYDHILYNAPYGERILINDTKPSGLKTSIAIETERDIFCTAEFIINDKL
jgi:ribonucleotide monophosphatase NagD (HAD superfamily)